MAAARGNFAFTPEFFMSSAPQLFCFHKVLLCLEIKCYDCSVSLQRGLKSGFSPRLVVLSPFLNHSLKTKVWFHSDGILLSVWRWVLPQIMTFRGRSVDVTQPPKHLILQRRREDHWDQNQEHRPEPGPVLALSENTLNDFSSQLKPVSVVEKSSYLLAH